MLYEVITLQSIESISAVAQQTAAASQEVNSTTETQITLVEDLRGAVTELMDRANMLDEQIKMFKIV